MTKSHNFVSLEGYIGRKPELWNTQKGKQILTFSLATSYSWKDEDGEWNTITDWHLVIVHNLDTIKWACDALDRGSRVRVQGKLIYYEWEDKFHQRRRQAQVLVSEKWGWVNLILRPKSTPLSSLQEGGLAKQEEEDRVPNQKQEELEEEKWVFAEQDPSQLTSIPLSASEGDLND